MLLSFFTLFTTDSDTLSPTLSPEPPKELCVSGLEDGSEGVDVEKEGSDSMHTSSSDDGLFAKSSMCSFCSV